jgi:hypothetical protein
MLEFSTQITYDEENLLTMSKENLRVVLEKRANDKIEREKQIAIEAKEQERKRINTSCPHNFFCVSCYTFSTFSCPFEINGKIMNFNCFFYHFNFNCFFKM